MNVNHQHAQYRLTAMAAEDAAMKYTRLLEAEKARRVVDMVRHNKLKRLVAVSWEIADVANAKAGEMQ